MINALGSEGSKTNAGANATLDKMLMEVLMSASKSMKTSSNALSCKRYR